MSLKRLIEIAFHQYSNVIYTMMTHLKPKASCSINAMMLLSRQLPAPPSTVYSRMKQDHHDAPYWQAIPKATMIYCKSRIINTFALS